MAATKKRKFSPVWDYFEHTSRNKVKCILCSKELGYNDNTSSMLRHLRALHETMQDASCLGNTHKGESEAKIEDPQPCYIVEHKGLTKHVRTVNPFVVSTSPERAAAEELEKLQDHNYQDLHCSLPVVSTGISLSGPGSTGPDEGALKLKRQTNVESTATEAPTSTRDYDELFLLSLLPSLKRLTIKKRMEVRMKFQQVLYAAEFED